jgi:hypothetical protein
MFTFIFSINEHLYIEFTISIGGKYLLLVLSSKNTLVRLLLRKQQRLSLCIEGENKIYY